ncbi:MAG: endo-1,4-beta-xylanase [Verrucomicrobiota bacterium]|nr:endo-1,4-beta-xylanase [Verrucomicrobiota bacterium]
MNTQTLLDTILSFNGRARLRRSLPDHAGPRAGLFTLALLSLVALGQAQTPFSLLPSNTVSAFTYSGGAASNREVVGVAGMPFTSAQRLRTPTPNDGTSGAEYRYRIRANISAAVAQGDRIRATFWARCVEPEAGYAFTRLILERNNSPWTKSISKIVHVNRSWQKFQVSFTMAESYSAGAASIQFWLGYDLQQIEIGGISVLDYRTTQPPLDPVSYQGREQDAPWRAGAAERIEQFRKGDLTALVTDSAGNPVPDAWVSARMYRHAFGFGSAVVASRLLGTGTDNQIYQGKVRELFTKVVFENDLKWPQWESNRQRPQDALAWLWSNGIWRVRGHTLIWPNWNRLPANVQTDYNQILASEGREAADAWLRDRINYHIWDEAWTLAGWLEDWDVVNEPYTNNQVINILGRDEMAGWFQRAREVDPYARLFFNDYGILSNGGSDYFKHRYYFNTIPYLEGLGAPIEGFGMQGHFGSVVTPPETLLAVLDRFAAAFPGKPLQVTEFDIDTTNETLQADYTRDFMTLVFSHPAVNSVLMWGFWQGSHWKPNAAMYRTNWSIKPNGEAYNDLLFNQWWTNADGLTDGNGQYGVRGFLGDYEVTVYYGEQVKSVYVSLPPEGLTVPIALD